MQPLHDSQHSQQIQLRCEDGGQTTLTCETTSPTVVKTALKIESTSAIWNSWEKEGVKFFVFTSLQQWADEQVVCLLQQALWKLTLPLAETHFERLTQVWTGAAVARQCSDSAQTNTYCTCFQTSLTRRTAAVAASEVLFDPKDRPCRCLLECT